MTQFLQISLAAAIFSGLLLLRQSQTGRSVSLPSLRGRHASILLLGLYLALTILNVQTRDMDDLTSSGLSMQNRIQVVLVMVTLIWSAFLILTTRISMSYLVSGPGFWVFCLIGVYGLSTLWSTWPSLTLFRVMELAAFWVLSAHVFARQNWFAVVDRFLWTVLLLYLLRGCLYLAGFVEGESSGNPVIGLMRSNSGSLIAGLLTLWTVQRWVEERQLTHLFKLFFVLFTLLLFGSLATVLTLCVCLFLYLVFLCSFEVRAILLCIAVVAAIAVPNILLMTSGEIVDPLVVFIGELFSKPTEHITGMTGRMELWGGIWDVTRDSPWGFGYAALERTFALSNTQLSWTAGNAHNGFISAWLGAGLLAVAFVIALFLSLAGYAVRQNSVFLPLVLCAAILIAVNNLSVPAVGGRLTVILIALIALTHLPGQRYGAGERTVLTARHRYA